MKAKYYEIRGKSTGFSNNGVKFKGIVVRMGGYSHTLSLSLTHTHTYVDSNNLYF
jgi:acyl-homoserine lactone acylase PvdQ